ncbi:MAG: hypothetical protein H0T95_10645 [Chthoniobacterales bacterium]|jgi:hypothetical protein|nr:hypothetical protein [Chthoniobacterales bacterium]
MKVQEADGSVIFTTKLKLTGGSKKTADGAEKHKKPCLHLHAGHSDAAARLLSFN